MNATIISFPLPTVIIPMTCPNPTTMVKPNPVTVGTILEGTNTVKLERVPITSLLPALTMVERRTTTTIQGAEGCSTQSRVMEIISMLRLLDRHLRVRDKGLIR